jgi:hypothetical protein
MHAVACKRKVGVGQATDMFVRVGNDVGPAEVHWPPGEAWLYGAVPTLYWRPGNLPDIYSVCRTYRHLRFAASGEVTAVAPMLLKVMAWTYTRGLHRATTRTPPTPVSEIYHDTTGTVKSAVRRPAFAAAERGALLNSFGACKSRMHCGADDAIDPRALDAVPMCTACFDEVYHGSREQWVSVHVDHLFNYRFYTDTLAQWKGRPMRQILHGMALVCASDPTATRSVAEYTAIGAAAEHDPFRWLFVRPYPPKLPMRTLAELFGVRMWDAMRTLQLKRIHNVAKVAWLDAVRDDFVYFGVALEVTVRCPPTVPVFHSNVVLSKTTPGVYDVYLRTTYDCLVHLRGAPIDTVRISLTPMPGVAVDTVLAAGQTEVTVTGAESVSWGYLLYLLRSGVHRVVLVGDLEASLSRDKSGCFGMMCLLVGTYKSVKPHTSRSFLTKALCGTRTTMLTTGWSGLMKTSGWTRPVLFHPARTLLPPPGASPPLPLSTKPK